THLRHRDQLLFSVVVTKLRVAGDHGRVEAVRRGVVLAADTRDELLVEVHAGCEAGDHSQRHSGKNKALHVQSHSSVKWAGYQVMLVPNRNVRIVGAAPPTSGS